MKVLPEPEVRPGLGGGGLSIILGAKKPASMNFTGSITWFGGIYSPKSLVATPMLKG